MSSSRSQTGEDNFKIRSLEPDKAGAYREEVGGVGEVRDVGRHRPEGLCPAGRRERNEKKLRGILPLEKYGKIGYKI